MNESSFVSRAGRKLAHALIEFDLDVTGLVCADFGCNVGGFTDCLLQRGAARVYAIDVGRGQLAASLRADPRVVVLERTNARALPPLDRPRFLAAAPPSHGRRWSFRQWYGHFKFLGLISIV